MRALALLPLLLAATPACAFTYDDCMALVAQAPDRAEAEAERWARHGGGDAAAHCAAMALAARGAYSTAAERLAELAARSAEAPAATRAAMLVQAAGFWRRDGAPSLSRDALDRALALTPQNPDALAARADLSAVEGHLSAAFADLAAARAARPGDPDLLIQSAALRRSTGDAQGARADADAALRAGPPGPARAAALFERGAAQAALGARARARADWLDAIAAAPDSADAERARLALQDLESQ